MEERPLLKLATGLASHIEDQAHEITDRWMRELESRLGVRTSRLLPTKGLRDHIPDVVRGLGQILRVPDAEPPVEWTDYLRRVAELRREQGYDVQEILREFESLSEIVFEEAGRWLEERETSGGEVATLLGRLRAGLGRIGVITVDTYQEAHLREKREVSERLAEFARTLEHEIRTPLQTAVSSAEVLGRDEIAGRDDLRRDYARLIRGRLKRIGELLDDIREFSIAEDAVSEVRWEPLREVVQHVFDEVSDLAARHEVELRMDEPLPEIRVDSARVKVALMNLVTNGIKYSDPEKNPRWVRVHAREVDRADPAPVWHVAVEDNGLGVPADLRTQIFQRFVRGYADRIQGTGMGLAIVKEVVEQRGGQIHLDSVEGQGSTFTLEIPPRLGESQPEAEEVGR